MTKSITKMGRTFFTDQEAMGFRLSASKSRITPSCCVDVSPSGQLRRARTANSFPSGEQHAAVQRKYNYENENEIKCARSLTINKFSQPQLSDNTLEQYYRGPALLR